MARTFEDRVATREQVPLLVGLIGPSGTGKTFSALRLATGIQRVSGGDIFVIDTEARRSLHYADRFRFRHIPFGAPFSPLDYLEAIEYAQKRGAKVVIVDSMSHEHEGPGGVLEMHEQEVQRLSRGNVDKVEKVKMLAWGKPKSARRRLINTILQMSINCIFCFRSKEKLKIEKGKDPENRGFMPIAGEEFVYEMTLKALLLPGADGVPTWQSNFEGEKLMMKLPEQFRALFANPAQLSEDIGQQLATWAAGTSAPKAVDPAELSGRYQSCSDHATYRVLEEERKAVWSKLGAEDKKRLKALTEATLARLQKQDMAAEQPSDEDPPARVGDESQLAREPGED